MKIVFSILLLLVLSLTSLSQEVFPYMDNMEFMRSFKDGSSTQVEHIPPHDLKYSEEIIAYMDHKNDLFIFDGKEKELLSNMANSYKIGYNLCAWNTGPIIYVWENGKKQILTRFGRNYLVSDSLVVFDDHMENAICAYYNDSIYTLFKSVDVPQMPTYVGSNSVAFKGNGDIYYTFISGKILELGVINDYIVFAPGANKIAFNDPFNQSFAVAHKNEIIDLESIMVKDYKAGWDIIAYRDLNENLICYTNGELIELSNYNAYNYTVFRNTVVWNEAGLFFVYDGEQKFEIANYIPDEYKIRDGIVVFRDLNGGVSIYEKGEVKVISNLSNVPFDVNGNTVRIHISRGNYIFYKDGKFFDM